MTYTRSAIGLLTRQYRSVLKKCFLINCGLFALGAVGAVSAGVANAATTLTPTLDDMKLNAADVLPTLGKYTLTGLSGTAKAPAGTQEIGFNGRRYYFTPAETTAEKANMLSYLAGSMAVAYKTGTDSNYLFKAGSTYYTIDTTKLPTSIYTLTEGTSSDYNWSVTDGTTTSYYKLNFPGESKRAKAYTYLSDSGTGAQGSLTVKLPNNENRTVYYYYDPSTVAISRVGDLSGNISGKVYKNINTTSTTAGGVISNPTTNGYSIIADFIGNRVISYSSSSYVYGGVIYNYGTISSITGDFVGNYASGPGFYAYGGAIYNSYGTISSITGDFVGNYASGASSYTYGGAIYNNESAIGSIVGDFVGNYASSSSSAYGGAIWNNKTISSITGDFIGNYASGSSSAAGGAIYSGSSNATISSITGDFVGNYASGSSASGGAISNGGIISSITGDFVGNSSSYQGGAISNGGTISSITGDFVGNSSTSSSKAYGGAISNHAAYTSSIANIGSIVGDFVGNYAKTTSTSGKAYGGGAIFNGYESSGTPQYRAGAQITLAGNTFTGNYVDNNGTITPNSIYNAGIINIADGATVTINDGYDSLSQAQLNIGTLANSGSIFNLNGTQVAHNIGVLNNNGTINLANNVTTNVNGQITGSTGYINIGTSANSGSIFNINANNGAIQTDALGTVTNNGTINWDLDVSLSGTPDSDKITVASLTGTKSIIIRAINLTTGTGSAQIEVTLTTNATLKAAYTLSDDILSHITSATGVDYEVNTVDYDSNTGKLIFNKVADTLLVANATSGTRSFGDTELATVSSVYKPTADLTGTAAGNFTINGTKSGTGPTAERATIDLDTHAGFDLVNDTTLNINNTKVTNGADGVVITVSNADANVNLNGAYIDGNIAVDSAVESYTLGLSGENIITGSVGKASTALSSGTLTVGSTTLQNATLNATGGTVILSGDGVHNYQIGSLTSTNGAAYNIDFNITDASVPTAVADTITATGSGKVKLGLLNMIGASVSAIPQNMIGKTFNVQILKGSSANLQLELSDYVKSQLGNTVYDVAKETLNVDDVVGAPNTWETKYYHKTQEKTFKGTMGLATTTNANDSIGITLNGESSLGPVVVGDSLGDTLALVNALNADGKTFDATATTNSYTTSEDLGETNGKLTINGVADAETISTIDFGETHKAFEKIDTGAEVNLNNVKLTNANGDIANVVGGKLTATNSEIDGTLTSAGTVSLTNSSVSGTVTNNGTLSATNGSTLGALTNTATATLTNSSVSGDVTNSGTLNLSNSTIDGIIIGSGDAQLNVNSDWDMDTTVTGHMVNVSNAKLTVNAGNLVGSDSLTAKDGSEIDIAANKVSLNKAEFKNGSKLSLKVDSLNNFGAINANNITVENGANLSATLAQGIVKIGQTETLQLLKADNTDFNNFADSYDNNMYHFEKADKSGLYNISQVKTAKEVVEESGGTTTEARAAGAWVDGDEFAEGSTAKEVADALADLAQNDAQEFNNALSVVAPQDAPVVETAVTDVSDKLLLTVENHLTNNDIGGLSSGDMLQDVSIWAKGYYGKSKLSDSGNIRGFDSKNKGVIAGVDKKLNNAVKLGFGFQYNDSDIDAFRRDVEVDTVTGFIYGEYRPSNWYVNGVASYGRSDYKEKKYALGFKINDKYNADTYSLQAITGYDFKYVSPEIGARYYHIKRYGYDDSIGQKVSGSSMDLLRGVIGLRSSHEFGMFKPEVYVGMTYDIVNDKDNAIVSLPNGSSYAVDGKRLNRFGTEVNTNLTANLTDHASVTVGYEGKFRKDYKDNTGLIVAKYAF